ncbi:MBL fold metallo-hydrolase [Muricoccus radiodurans]|uniref:MBL fold metallo-hydrolase n=1 Tax=Muricoccus radiodurans TaxID=2231721 RepID=UPI003CEB347E
MRTIAAGLALALAAAPALAQPQDVRQHIATARQAAGTDLTPYMQMCRSADPAAAPEAPPAAARIAMGRPAPGRAFDNLYFLGNHWTTAWALTTSEGIIILDAMDNDDDAEHSIEAGLRRFGLDPANIRYVIVSHGHWDHYGGANRLKRLYGARIVMSEPDWRMLETRLEFDSPRAGRPPARDMVVNGGDRITLGDTTVELLATPGHTMGTLSPMFTVRHNGQEHRAVIWGGTSFNFGRQPARLQAYIDGSARALQVARDQRADVFLSNHAFNDEAVARTAALAANPRMANPFVIGTDGVQRAITVLHECARATMASWR